MSMTESTKEHLETETVTKESTNNIGDPNWPKCNGCARGTLRIMGFNPDVVNPGRKSCKPIVMMCCNKYPDKPMFVKRMNHCPIDSFVERTTEVKYRGEK
jgi:hypothetical protein